MGIFCGYWCGVFVLCIVCDQSYLVLIEVCEVLICVVVLNVVCCVIVFGCV